MAAEQDSRQRKNPEIPHPPSVYDPSIRNKWLLTQTQGQTDSVPQPSTATGQDETRGMDTAQLSAVQNRRKSETTFTTHSGLLTISTIEIQYMFSKAPISQIPLLGPALSDAVQTSGHWKMERRLGEITTDCLTTMIPEDRNQDISITLWVGPERGLQLKDIFNLQKTWSSSRHHLSL